MRIKDAFLAMKSDAARTAKSRKLSTVWSEQTAKAAALLEYPRPQLQREQWICLNGAWNYAFTEGRQRPSAFDGLIQVPFSPECDRSGVGRRLEPGAYLWYYRVIELEEIPKGKQLLLHFGAVDERCSVWWNGKLLGSHRNGYLPFSFDVTKYLHCGRNTLWVRVQDDTDSKAGCRGKQTLKPGGMFYTAQSGIWQTVWMEWVPEQRIETLKITPLYDEGAVLLEIGLTRPEDVEITIWADEEQSENLEKEENKWSDTEETGAAQKVDLQVQVRKEAWTGTVTIPIPGFHSWSPEDPFLYKMRIIAGEDTVQSYFAMRKFSVGLDEKKHPRLMLNNQPYFFNGVLDQGYWPESLYTPPSDEAMIFDIRKMKDLGFHMMRKHIKIEPMRWYYHCDRLGMVVWQDMVNGGGKLNMSFLCYLPTLLPAVTNRIKDHHYRWFARQNKKEREQWEKDCIAMVEHLYNCPCIGLWVPFNEGWGQFDALCITDKIRQADKTRPIDHASGWFDQGGGDIKSVHNYFRTLKVKKDHRPFVISEYGGYSCPVEEHLYSPQSYGYRAYQTREAFTEAFDALQQKISALESEGLSGAVYTQVSDVEDEINGLYTYDSKVCKVIQKGYNI